jgi:hypothetical protein
MFFSKELQSNFPSNYGYNQFRINAFRIKSPFLNPRAFSHQIDTDMYKHEIGPSPWYSHTCRPTVRLNIVWDRHVTRSKKVGNGMRGGVLKVQKCLMPPLT